MPDQLLLQGTERAVVAFPELPRRMQNVDMRHLPADPLEAVEQVPRLEDGSIERLAVEADERACALELARDRGQHGPLVSEARHDELASDESIAVEPSAAHEKDVCARAAAQARRFEIKKHERRTGVVAGEERRCGEIGRASCRERG